jgi:hypothetical protein
MILNVAGAICPLESRILTHHSAILLQFQVCFSVLKLDIYYLCSEYLLHKRIF